MSDALCRLSTGGGLGTRTLFENDEEFIFSSKRPMILNGINDPAVRSDLLDRTIQIELPADEAYRPESELERLFTEHHPQILGALLDFAAAALANRDQVESMSHRMADFEAWMRAAERNPKRPDWWSQGDFADAYRLNRHESDAIALSDNAVIVEALQRLLEAHNTERMLRPNEPVWTGSSNQLLNALAKHADKEPAQLVKNGNPRAFACVLKRLIPNLLSIGIKVVIHRGRRLIEIYNTSPRPCYTDYAASGDGYCHAALN